MTAPSWRTGPLAAIAGSALAIGLVATWHYAGADLTLSHYDARGHLVVSRRIIDSITPGWQQVGAVWLPLPHLLDALPVQVDALYRTGGFAVAISVASFAVACAAIAWLIAALTGSWLAAAAGTAVFAANPNVLYLQATPMTEPLLMALALSAVALLVAWCANRQGEQSSRPSTRLVGWMFTLACLTRYEAWPVTVAALAVAVVARWQLGRRWHTAVGEVSAIAVYPLGAIVLFSIFSRVVVGSWFASGFFVPENPAQGHPYQAIEDIVWGLRELSGVGVLAAAALGAVVLIARTLRSGSHAGELLPLTLLSMAAVSWVAFFDGHPYRIRYMVPLVTAEAVLAGVAAGSWRRARLLTVAALAAIVAVELQPLDRTAAMVLEAQWDRPNAAARTRVTACLHDAYDGDTVMASMGSLGHYMQDLSRVGFSVRDFLHEGNGDIWLNALHSPRPFAGWILIEETAEGGDMLAAIVRERGSFLDGYTRVCEGGGVALYRRE